MESNDVNFSDGEGGKKDPCSVTRCQLCFGDFADPRVLPCQHVYCKSCLDILATEDGVILCPECQAVSPLPAEGVVGLPGIIISIKHQINCMSGLVSRMNIEGGGGAVGGAVDSNVSSDNIAKQCQHHPNRPLDLYCCKCGEVTCHDCIHTDRKHEGHPVGTIEEGAEGLRREIGQKFASLLQTQSTVEGTLENVQKVRKIVTDSCKSMSVEIADSYEQAVRIIEEKKRREIQQVQNEACVKQRELEDFESTLANTLSEVQSMQSVVEYAIGGSEDLHLLLHGKETAGKLDQLQGSIDRLPAFRTEVAILHGQVLGAPALETLAQVCDNSLQMYVVVDPLHCTVEASENAVVHEATSVFITLKDSHNRPCSLNFEQSIVVELRSSRFDDVVKATVAARSWSYYEASYIPNLRTRGRCQLTVKVNGHLLGSKPIEVFITCPPQCLGQPVHIINGIKTPDGLKIVDDRMFCIRLEGLCVIDIKDIHAPPKCIPVIVPKRLSRVETWRAAEMACDEDFLYVTDTHNNMVHKFTIEGKYLTRAGGKGTAPGKFYHINGVCVGKDGNLYICDCGNHRIQVLTRMLQFIRCFGSRGSEPGQFSSPDNIEFDSNGQMFVTDPGNSRVQCLTENAEPIMQFGERGRGPRKFKRPNVMEIVGNHVYVTDDYGIQVFTTNGDFIAQFATMCAVDGVQPFNGLAFDKDGFVFVSDRSRDRIVVF